MVFDARAHLTEMKNTHKDFEFFDLEGQVHKLPNIQLLEGTLAARLMGGDEEVIKEINAAAYEAIVKMPLGVGEALAEAWIDAGGPEGKEESESSSTESAGEVSS